MSRPVAGVPGPSRIERHHEDLHHYREETLVLVLAVLIVGAPAFAQDRTRVEVYDKESRRQESVVIDEKNSRVDTYDKGSKHTGYGVIRQDGRVDLYDVDGSRKGSVTTKGRR